jgi:hypothetical protein
VPPEVTTGRVVVVVGGEVVVVVGGAVVVGDVATEDEPWSDELGVVVGGDVTVVEVLGDVVVGTCAGAAFDALAPGCSLATTTPMTAVAAVAATATKRVRNRRVLLTRCLVSGE